MSDIQQIVKASDSKFPARHKSELYLAVIFAKLSQEYADMILRDKLHVKREARHTLAQHTAGITKFINQTRNGIATEEARQQFDAEWKKDYLAWAAIFTSLIGMTPEQIAGVERFCEGVLTGEVEVVLSEEASK